MPGGKSNWSDRKIDIIISVLLRAGVILSAFIVLTGGVIYLSESWNAAVNYNVFKGEAGDLRSPAGIVKEALSFKARGLIQLGLLILIATPVMRVLFTVLVFLLQRDKIYIIVTIIVLGLLIFSIMGG